MLYTILIISTLVSSSLCDSKDGGKAPRIPLNDGNSIPGFGLGTFLGFEGSNHDGTVLKQVEEGEVENAVTWALDAGYRLIDTAAVYHTEEQIGQALQKTKIPREDIFVVTKLAVTEQKTEVEALKDSLEKLNLTYVDLFLIHFPMKFSPDYSKNLPTDYLDTWKGMEEVKKLGLAKSIGISNFNISQMERVLDNCEIKPAVLQVEVNLQFDQKKIIEFCKDNDMVVMAYTPFGRLFDKDTSLPPPRVDDPVLTGIAEKYSKTVPQLVLRYLVQRGIVPIPKSVHKNRIEQNIDIFDFELSTEEMNTISKFNRDYRSIVPSFWQEHPYYPFSKVDVPRINAFTPKPTK